MNKRIKKKQWMMEKKRTTRQIDLICQRSYRCSWKNYLKRTPTQYGCSHMTVIGTDRKGNVKSVKFVYNTYPVAIGDNQSLIGNPEILNMPVDENYSKPFNFKDIEISFSGTLSDDAASMFTKWFNEYKRSCYEQENKEENP